MADISNIKHALDAVLKAANEAAQDYNQLLNDNMKQQFEISELKTEIGRLEALLADKKPESECECDYNCDCCKHRDEADEEHEPTLKDLYELGKYLVDTVDEIEAISIRVVRNKNANTDDTE